MKANTLIIIKNVSIFDGSQIKKDKTVIIYNDKIQDIKNSVPTSVKYHGRLDLIKQIDGKGHFLIPGFIDIQVNGGGDVLLNDAPTIEGIQKIFDTHLKYGTTSILPTLISDSFSTVQRCLLTIQKLCSIEKSGILGAHIEGPFLSVEKSGIHPKHNLSLPSKKWLELFINSNISKLLVTLAPEIVSKKFIQSLVKNGIYVFAGHTNANEAVIKNAFDNGVSGVTHLFNACSQITSRDAGVVGAALLNKNILCSFIVDGQHVSYDTLRLALRLKDYQKCVLVSDAMPSVNSKKQEFILFKEKIYRHKNKLCNADGVLAGAHLTMLWAFQNLLKHKLAKFEEAVAMTSSNQAEFFRFSHKGAVLPNYDANLLLIDKNTFNILKIIFFGTIKNTK